MKEKRQKYPVSYCDFKQYWVGVSWVPVVGWMKSDCIDWIKLSLSLSLSMTAYISPCFWFCYISAALICLFPFTWRGFVGRGPVWVEVLEFSKMMTSVGFWLYLAVSVTFASFEGHEKVQSYNRKLYFVRWVSSVFCCSCFYTVHVISILHCTSLFVGICICFPPLFYTFFLKSGIDKSTEWSMIPACPSLMCFFNRGDTAGTKSSKIRCSMFVYVLFYVNLCTGLILWFLNNLCYDDLRAE